MCEYPGIEVLETSHIPAVQLWKIQIKTLVSYYEADLVAFPTSTSTYKVAPLLTKYSLYL